MSVLKLTKMTFGSLFKKPETTLYPFETKPAPAGLKGHVEVNPDVCILCGICMKRCPCSAITVDKKERVWSLKQAHCVQCGFCTRECPKKCLSMLPTYSKPGTMKRELVIPIPER